MKPNAELPDIGRTVRIPTASSRGYALATVRECWDPFCHRFHETDTHVHAWLRPGERMSDREANWLSSFIIMRDFHPWEYEP